MTYKTPGVYVKEIPSLPPSIAQVETAIPAFIGYTAKTEHNGNDLEQKPVRITSLNDFEEIFGTTPPVLIETGTGGTGSGSIVLTSDNGEIKLKNPVIDPYPKLTYRLYYALRLFYSNGGGECYIISCGKASTGNASSHPAKGDFEDALDELQKEDEPTIIVMPDLIGLGEGDYYGIYKKALKQCGKLKDRVVLIDVYSSDRGDDEFSSVEENFRTKIGNNSLKYGAAYYPWLQTSLNYLIEEDALDVTFDGTPPAHFGSSMVLRKYEEDLPEDATETEEEEFFENSLYHVDGELYADIKDEIENYRVILPATSAMAGIYAFVDRTRGVWKAPANVSLNSVKAPMVKIDDEDQEKMNVDSSGKSVNAIREFTGKGIMVWGARTLAGNDNEWRYIPVRRFFNMVEESVKRGSEQFVFESNDANTWNKLRAMIENFLTLQWRAGALQGAAPDDAFFVSVGLGETMTAQDILEGRMIVEIGMAVVRPAEFIILRFTHKMVES